MWKMGTRRDRGFTLVELLLVITILAVMTGTMSVGISLMYSRDTEKCARTIDSALEAARMNSLSRVGTYTMRLDMSSNELKVISTVIDEVTHAAVDQTIYVEQLQKRVVITAAMDGGSTAIPADSTLLVRFDKSTGKISYLGFEKGGTTDISGEGTGVLRIYSSDTAGSKKSTVVLVKNTGKHYVEYH